MKKNRFNLLIIALIMIMMIILGSLIYFYGISSQNSGLTESQAISLLKNKYPEFQNYPSNELAPKSIKTEEASDGWYVAFIQEGSGRPIISAKCFFVDKQRNTIDMKSYNPGAGEDSVASAEFSAKTCSPVI